MSKNTAHRFDRLKETESFLTSKLNAQTKLLHSIKQLIDQPREVQIIEQTPRMAITKAISAKELPYSDVLKEACKSKNKAEFDCAVDKTANFNYQDSEGKTIMMHALINSFYYGVDKLLKLAVNVNLVDKQGANALIYASGITPHIKYIKQIAELTINKNLQVKNFSDCNALHLLFLNNGGKIVFASELNGELPDMTGQNCLLVLDEDYIITSWSGNIVAGAPGLRLTVGRNNVTINLSSTIDKSFAENVKLSKLVHSLVSLGVDINAQNDKGLTPFFLMCKYKSLTPLIHEILNKDQIDYNLTDKFGFNALHWILETKEQELVDKVASKMMIEGISIDQGDNQGRTALMWAVQYKLPEVVNLLINKYHAQDIPNQQGFTAWNAAILSLEDKIIDIFLPIKQEVDLQVLKLWCAARKGDAAAVEQYVKGVNLDATVDDYQTTTVLIQAVISGSVEAVTTLVNNGANINKADQDQISPLYYSLGVSGQTIKPSIVKFLITKGADVNQAMNDGDTPLHMAAYSACVGAIKLLIDSGAKVDATNLDGKTPLYVLLEKTTLPSEQKLTAVKYLLCRSALTDIQDKDEHDAIFVAQQHFADALPFLEHRESLPTLSDFETTIAGHIQDFN